MNETRAPSTPDRIQDNILARQERRLLGWLCAHMPRRVTPDLLTIVGLIGAFLTFFGYTMSLTGTDWLLLAIAGYVLQWFGDSMDGSLARHRKIERPSYGYFIDHSVDGLTVFLIAAGLGLSPFVTMDIALICLAGYLLMAIHTFLAARVLGEVRLSYMAAGPTEMRFILIALTVAMLITGPLHHTVGSFSWFDVVIGAMGAVLIGLFVYHTIATGLLLSAADKRRAGPKRKA